MSLIAFQHFNPQVASSAWIASSAQVIGDVEIGEDSSIWFQTVVRGDVNSIRIGARTNIQDLSMIHVSNRHGPQPAVTVIGNDVTVGHRVILHGCTLKDGCLVGMGAVVMDHAVVGEGAMVAAGSLVVEKTIVPPGFLAIGSPAKVLRPLKDKEKLMLQFLPEHYAKLAKAYAGS